MSSSAVAPIAYLNIIISLSMFAHSMYQRHFIYNRRRIVSDISYIVCATQAIIILQSQRANTSVFGQTIYVNVIAHVILGLMSQLCDQSFKFLRFSSLLPMFRARIEYFPARLTVARISVYTFLLLFMTWVPFHTVLPAFYNMNSTEWSSTATALKWVYFSAYCVYDAASLNAVIYTMKGPRNLSVRGLLHETVFRRKTVFQSVMTMLGMLFLTTLSTEGIMLRSLLNCIGIHFSRDFIYRVDFSLHLDKARRLLQEPPMLVVLLSLALFLPALGSMHISADAFSVHSPDARNLFVSLSCSLAVLVPQLGDMTLDYVNKIAVPHIEYRLANYVAFTIANVFILCTIDKQERHTAVVCFFLWSYFVDYGLSIVLAAMEMKELFAVSKPVMYGSVMCVFSCIYLLLLSTMTIPNVQAIRLATLLVFVLVSAGALISSYLWFSYMFKRYRSPTSYAKLPHSEYYTSIIFASATIQIIIFYIVFFIYNSTPHSSSLINADNLFLIVLSRSTLTLLSYMLVSRVFRQQLINNKLQSSIKTELIKYVSHEMRTPIMGVSVGLEVLQRMIGASNEPLQECFGDIRDSCNQATSILDSMLLYEAIESNTLTLELSLLKPMSSLTELIRSYDAAAARANLEIHIEHANDHFFGLSKRLHIDTSKLKIIFDALLFPAIKSLAREGGVLLKTCFIGGGHHSRLDESDSINCRSEKDARFANIISDHSSLLRIEMIDTRSRLTIRDLDQMTSDDVSFSREGHGDGMSVGFLYWIARRLVLLHGGELHVELKCDPSCCVFTLVFPLVENVGVSTSHASRIYPRAYPSVMLGLGGVDPPIIVENDCDPVVKPSLLNLVSILSAAKEPHPWVTIDEEEKDSHVYKVLIVDDSALIRKMMHKLLAAMSYVCLDADDGDSAVEMIRGNAMHKIDLILLDNQMPRLNGSKAVAIMRNTLHYEGIVIGVTGNATEADLREFIACGADDVIVKPLNSEKFLQAIQIIEIKRKEKKRR